MAQPKTQPILITLTKEQTKALDATIKLALERLGEIESGLAPPDTTQVPFSASDLTALTQCFKAYWAAEGIDKKLALPLIDLLTSKGGSGNDGGTITTNSGTPTH